MYACYPYIVCDMLEGKHMEFFNNNSKLKINRDFKIFNIHFANSNILVLMNFKSFSANSKPDWHT